MSSASRRTSGFAIALVSLAAAIAALMGLNEHIENKSSGVTLIYAGPTIDPAGAQAANSPTSDALLRICADPNNLPFSNDRGEGFENALAELIARDLNRKVTYTWWPQRRGFVRSTMQANACDLIIGVPEHYELTDTTRAYYRSSYAFITRSTDRLEVRSLDDPRLRTLRIGLHAIGDDYSNVPPAQALASRGIVTNVRGYSIYGDYSQPNPPADLIRALARGQIDIAIAWGPLAGYFSQREAVGLIATPIVSAASADIPMAFGISMGVRRNDDAFKAQVEQVLANRQHEIEDLLLRYNVPLISPAEHLAHITSAGK